ncbi:MAG: leader peptidase (prepilin peptidase) / N-methyltransferase [Parcubacteria group bacterium Gr01-1014_72]|nr:MAG: leader peptidase (prepilin peptidase) / N-methyltransferase [Parcubacteria group bacterium Gr01-1014_72]
MLSTVSFSISLFILGTIVGSFLNVLVLRYRTGRSIVRGRSACPSCGHTLSAVDLVPIASFLLCRGRCRYCGSRLSWQYPLVELLAGLAFLGVFLHLKPFTVISGLTGSMFHVSGFKTALFLLHAAAWSTLIAIAAYDMRHKIIPDAFVYTFIALGALQLFLFGEGESFFHLPTGAELVSGPLLALPFAALWFFSRGRWMGFGDAKLAWGLGWFLPLQAALSGVVLGFWAGAIVGLLLIALSRLQKISRVVTMKSEIPFGPFLIFGAVLVYFFQC